MKFVYPINEKTAEEHYRINREGQGGFYPLGVNNTYHGGMHFDGDHSVVAIADGTIIAYRYNKKYIEEETGGVTHKYSNCFVLIRHKYKTPKGQEVVFFSHYNHLCPWDEFNATQKNTLPHIVSKPGYEITATNLSVRTGPSLSHPKVEGKVLGNGEKVVATAVDDKWAKIEGAEEYFHYKDYSRPQQITEPPELDQLTVCEIPVKAGTLIGYTGLYENRCTGRGYKTVHVEVFAGDDAEEFIKNPKGDGKKSQLLINEGAELYYRDKKHPDLSSITKLKRDAQTVVKIIEDNEGDDWIQVQDEKVIATVHRNWLDNYHRTTNTYKPLTEHLDNIKQAFNEVIPGLPMTADSNIEYIETLEEGQSGRRKVRFPVPEANAMKYWIERTWLTDDKKCLSNTKDCCTEYPDAPLFERKAEKVTQDCIITRRGVKTVKDGETLWYKVKPGSIEGWVQESGIKEVSPYDWPGFRILKEDSSEVESYLPLGNTSQDNWVDYEKLTPFFKKIFDQIDTEENSKGRITKDEMKSALGKPEIETKLSRLICYHQSEWWVDEALDYWKKVLERFNETSAEAFKKRLKELCWWMEVQGKISDFPSKSVYHLNPVAFIEKLISLQEVDVKFYIMRSSGEAQVEGPAQCQETGDNGKKIKVKETHNGETKEWILGRIATNKKGIAEVDYNHRLKQALLDGGIPGIPTLTERRKRIWASLWDSEGGISAINQWDGAFFSFGPVQQTIGTTDSKGELSAALAHIQATLPDIYHQYFGQYDLEPANTALNTTFGVEYSDLKLNGELMNTAAKKEEFRKFIWAYRAKKAMDDLAFREEFLRYGFKRIEAIENLKGTVNGTQVNFKDIFKSELAHALMLDFHINVPGKAIPGWRKVVEKLVNGGMDLNNLTQENEYSLIKEIIEERNSTNMSDKVKRAAMIVLCSKDLSDTLASKLGYSNIADIRSKTGASNAQQFQYNFLHTTRE